MFHFTFQEMTRWSALFVSCFNTVKTTGQPLLSFINTKEEEEPEQQRCWSQFSLWSWTTRSALAQFLLAGLMASILHWHVAQQEERYVTMCHFFSSPSISFSTLYISVEYVSFSGAMHFKQSGGGVQQGGSARRRVYRKPHATLAQR